MTGPFNPRYIVYAAANGRSPDEMLAFDRERFPGGQLAGFTLWISGKWREWRSINRRGHRDALGSDDHESFDRFIGVMSEGER